MKSFTLILTSIALFSCESKAGTGALVGGGLGVGAGALISGTPQGALIGGAVGAVSGALIGAALDADDRRDLQQQSPQTLKRVDKGQQLSITDIEKMSQAGISDDKIIGTIQSTGSIYHLSSSDIAELKSAGVSQHVIDYMQQTANQ